MVQPQSSVICDDMSATASLSMDQQRDSLFDACSVSQSEAVQLIDHSNKHIASDTMKPNGDTKSSPERGTSAKNNDAKKLSPSSNDSTKPLVLTETTKKLRWLLGTNYGDQPLLHRLNYLHLSLLTLTPIIAMYGICTTTIQTPTFIWAVIYYFMTGLGITAGYHRLFAHKAYEAVLIVKISLLLIGAGAFEGSVRWWARDHRAHHRYVDSEKDPYAITNGFWYAHIGRLNYVYISLCVYG